MSTVREVPDLMLPDAVQEALLDAVPGAPLSAERNAAVKDRVVRRVRADRAAHVTVRAGEGEWQPMGPLVDRRVLADDGVTRTFIMRLQPGAKRPSHSHAALEVSYVLEGTVRYGSLELKAGDYHEAAPGSVHEGVSSDTGALILIRAPVRPLPPSA
jgi:anti-sigma factor ChrR (cupin superfamily)